MERHARLYFYRTTNGAVACKVNFGTEIHLVHVGRRREVRTNHGTDREQYPFVVSISYLHAFLELNGVALRNATIDPRSVDSFYGFEAGSGQKFAATLTPRFVETWWNYDLPVLYRYRVNKERKEKGPGYNPLYFPNFLVQVWTEYVAVGNSLTQEELNRLIAGREDVELAQQMQQAFAQKQSR